MGIMVRNMIKVIYQYIIRKNTQIKLSPILLMSLKAQVVVHYFIEFFPEY